MKYWDIFTSTIKQWWKHKYLWIVGILGAILSGGGSGNFSSFNNNSSKNSTTYQEGMNNVLDYFRDPAHLTFILVVIVLTIIVGLALYVLGLYLHARADSALYQATQKISSNDEKIGFWKTWALGKYNLMTLIKQDLLVAIPVFVIMIIMGIAAVLSLPLLTSNAGQLAFFPLMIGLMSMVCLMVIYSIMISIAVLFGRRMIVLENLGVVDGLKKGFDFFIKNFSHVLMFWLISLISTIVVSMIMFFVLIVVLGIAVVAVLTTVLINPIIALIVGMFALLIFIILISLISGPVYTFSSMYWTNAYLEIKKYNETAK